MGLNLSWIAVQGGEKASLLGRLGFEEIGETGYEIGVEYACAEMPDGWLIFVAAKRALDLQQALAKVSAEGLVIGCSMSETVMVSEAQAFENGALLWSAVHDPDKDPPDVASGVLPTAFDEIKRRLEAEQAKPGNEDVDYLFDLPTALSASVCGYQAGTTQGLEWTVLQKSAGSRDVALTRGPRSLVAAIRAELLPLLQSLGWEFATARASFSGPDQIVRRLGGQEQTIWFDFVSGRETYIVVYFWTEEQLQTGSRYVVRGHVRNPPVRAPLWKRFTWTHLRKLTKSHPTPMDPITAAIEKAKDDIRAADVFLTTGERVPCIDVRFAGEVDRRT